MAKAVLRNPENASWRVIGNAMDEARGACRLSVKEFADAVQRDEAQCRRWFIGSERPQVDAVFGCGLIELRQQFIVKLALASGAGVEVETTVRIRRTA